MVSLLALMPFMAGAGLRQGRIGGVMAGGVKAWTGHLYAQSWAAEMAESDENRRWRGQDQWHGRRKRELTCGAHMSVIGKREGDVAQRHKSMKEMYSDKDDMGTQAYWAGWARWWPVGSGRPTQASWARSQEEIQMELIFKFQMNLEFGKTLRNFTRRYRRNLNLRILTKFF
jgi:hypothetical protein